MQDFDFLCYRMWVEGGSWVQGEGVAGERLRVLQQNYAAAVKMAKFVV